MEVGQDVYTIVNTPDIRSSKGSDLVLRVDNVQLLICYLHLYLSEIDVKVV